MGDLGVTMPRKGSGLIRYCLTIQLVGYFADGFTGVGAMQVRGRRVAKIGGLSGGGIGRKNSAQLF